MSNLPVRMPPEPESIVLVGHPKDRKESWMGETVRVVFARGHDEIFYRVSVVHLQHHVPTENQALPDSMQALAL